MQACTFRWHTMRDYWHSAGRRWHADACLPDAQRMWTFLMRARWLGTESKEMHQKALK